MASEVKDCNYCSVDISKFILALLVVAIHEMPFVSYSRIMNAFFVNEVCRIAVPVFFISTGFFLAQKGLSWQIIKRHSIKILKMYLIWSGVYLILEIFLCLVNGGKICDAILTYLFETIGGGYGHLWYLYSTIIGTIAAWIVFSKLRLKQKQGFALALVLYVLGAVVNDFWMALPLSGHIDWTYTFLQHSLFIALPYTMAGICISTTQERFKIKWYWILIFGGLLTLENALLFVLDTSSGYQNTLLMFPFTLSIFVWILNLKIRKLQYAEKLRLMSTYIYLVQGIFIAFVDMFLENSLIKYFLVVALCIAYSAVTYRIKCEMKVRKK